jgi:glycosyltransferase involved in cell wall biosynthesis
VLYSFPHKIGAGRICYTAWQQVNGIAAAGAEVMVMPGAIHKPVPHSNVGMRPTLARGRWRIPYRLLGTLRACALHDRIVASRLERIAGQIDVIHTWPLGALKTLKKAAELGIPTVLERPNAHTRFAYDVVRAECDRLGIALPPRHEHAFQPDVLAREEAEYEAATRLLCPSEFVAETFIDRGVPRQKLSRHQYGYDPSMYYPATTTKREQSFTMLFVGVCAVRKGLHFALEAWLRSQAHRSGRFLIAGEFLPAYADLLAAKLAHPSVVVLGHRGDIPELMRNADVLVLPSIEEGSPLACAEAIGSGCVPLVSEACTGSCRHLENALVHPIGDVDTLAKHINMVYADASLLDRLRDGALRSSPDLTWIAAGRKLLKVYADVCAAVRPSCVLG